jgi:hypothetical protein
MKLKLALAFAVLSCATVVRANSVTVGELPLIIPDGSTVTATAIAVAPWGDTYYIADYTFAYGTGFTEVNVSQEIVSGELAFNEPESDVSFTYYGGDVIEVVDNLGDIFIGNSPGGALNSGEFAGPGITWLYWQDGVFVDGITSVDPPSVPENSTFLLLGIGIICLLIVSFWRKGLIWPRETNS